MSGRKKGKKQHPQNHDFIITRISKCLLLVFLFNALPIAAKWFEEGGEQKRREGGEGEGKGKRKKGISSSLSLSSHRVVS